jgi:hypothetical protein
MYRSRHFFSVEDLQTPSEGFLTPGTKIPNPFLDGYGGIDHGKTVALTANVGLNPLALCHGTEKKTVRVSSYLANTTLNLASSPLQLRDEWHHSFGEFISRNAAVSTASRAPVATDSLMRSVARVEHTRSSNRIGPSVSGSDFANSVHSAR